MSSSSVQSSISELKSRSGGAARLAATCVPAAAAAAAAGGSTCALGLLLLPAAEGRGRGDEENDCSAVGCRVKARFKDKAHDDQQAKVNQGGDDGHDLFIYLQPLACSCCFLYLYIRKQQTKHSYNASYLKQKPLG